MWGSEAFFSDLLKEKELESALPDGDSETDNCESDTVRVVLDEEALVLRAASMDVQLSLTSQIREPETPLPLCLLKKGQRVLAFCQHHLIFLTRSLWEWSYDMFL